MRQRPRKNSIGMEMKVERKFCSLQSDKQHQETPFVYQFMQMANILIFALVAISSDRFRPALQYLPTLTH